MNKTTYLLPLLLLIVLVSARSEYEIINEVKSASSIKLELLYIGSEEYIGNPKSPIIKNLEFTFHVHSFNDFYVKIVDAKNKRFQVPQKDVFPIDPMASFSYPIAVAGVTIEYTFKPFDFKIIRRQNMAVLFSTYDQDFKFSDHFIQIGTQVQSEYLYGIGERFQESFRKKDGKWTVFNRDRGQVIDKGTGLQTYGYYPFYMMRERKNVFHINYFRSSNAMDVIKSTQNGKHYVTFKVIGGIIDFRFFLGEESPGLTVEKFNFYSGRSAIPPFWSFGYHQCRWGYKKVQDLQSMISNFQKNGIPLDIVWSDIDYMIDYEDFTIDQSRFPLDRMAKITQKYHYIPIIDAGIKTSGPAYEEGLKRGVYVMDATAANPYKGWVWPGQTTFVDFFHPNATKYWVDMLQNLYSKVKFSGVWLDMNELANFCNGPCKPPTEPTVFDYSKDLPYQPGDDNIQSHTISLNATHYGNLSEANVHAFSAFLQTHATNVFLKIHNERPFIITRSSTLGSNKYGFHWTGDNHATWQYLKGSIADNFNNQFFGFQMVGPDICGFGGNTNEELCARWYQIGALYTFARNHNDQDSVSQEPYALGKTVLESAKTNLKLRYSLLKYFYYLFINQRGIGSIWKPLFFEFPTDDNCYRDEIADTQFLIGYGLMAAPIVEQGQKSRKVYFPEVYWFNLHTGVRHAPGTQYIDNIGLTDKVPLFVREGAIMFTQNTEKVTRTAQLDNHFALLSGMHLDGRISNNTHQYYTAAGGMLSISNYNEESKITDCLKNGCDYGLSMNAVLTPTQRVLHLDIGYAGERKLQESIFIDAVHLNLNGDIYVITIRIPLEVEGPKRITLNIPHKSNLNKEEE